MNVLTIGYGTDVFREGSVERMRLKACAIAVGELHMVVFTRNSNGYQPVQDGPLTLYPTSSRTKIGMIFDAYRLGRMVCATTRVTHLSSQDPFEAGLVGWMLRMRFKTPLQVQEHGDFFGTSAWKNERLLNQARFLFGLWLLKRADCVRAVSRRVKTHLIERGVEEKRIVTFPVMTPLARFYRNTPSHSGEDVRIISVGRLVKQKRFDLLINAFSTLAKQYPRAHLTIVGSGPEESSLKAQVLSLSLTERITFIPWSLDVPHLMHESDIFALSSDYEGWARVVLEAMAAGLPVVMTEVGCAGEVCLAGVHGSIVPCGDRTGIEKALSRYIEDGAIRTVQGEQGMHDVRAWERTIEEYGAAWAESLRLCGGEKSL